MAGLTVAARAAESLRRQQDDLARAITEALYAERPELEARYGAAGREKCLQDMRYNLEHLAPAVAFAEPALFASYARWLAGLLLARGIPVGDVVRSLQLTGHVVAVRLPADEATAVSQSLLAGLDAIAAEGAPP
jgi:hypothetical protein